MKLAVALLTCDRFDYTVQTVESLLKHNDVSDWNLFYADDASTDSRMRRYVEAHGFEPLVLHEERKGCSPTTEELIGEVGKRVSAKTPLLYLQNDFESVRPLPLGIAETLLGFNDASFVQLAYRRPRHRRSKRIVWSWPGGQPWTYGDASHGDYVFTLPGVGCGYHPTIARLCYWADSVSGIRKERQFWRANARLGKRIYRLTDPVMRHIGRKATPNGLFGKSRRDRLATPVVAAQQEPEGIAMSRRRRKRRGRPDHVRIAGLHGISCLHPDERKLVLDCIPKEGAFLEIGTLHGATVATWAQARPAVAFTSVDPFVNVTVGRGGRENWARNQQPNMSLIPSTSDEASGLLPPRSFNVIFVDGAHAEDACYHDLVVSLALLSEDGQLIVHDFGNPRCRGVGAGVRRFCADHKYHVARWERTLAWLKAGESP